MAGGEYFRAIAALKMMLTAEYVKKDFLKSLNEYKIKNKTINK